MKKEVNSQYGCLMPRGSELKCEVEKSGFQHREGCDFFELPLKEKVVGGGARSSDDV